MDHQTGAILFALLLGILRAAAVAWGVAELYRRRMVALIPHVMPPKQTSPKRRPLASSGWMPGTWMGQGQ